MPDREVVESKLTFLREYLVDLSEYQTVSLSDYKKSSDSLSARFTLPVKAAWISRPISYQRVVCVSPETTKISFWFFMKTALSPSLYVKP